MSAVESYNLVVVSSNTSNLIGQTNGTSRLKYFVPWGSILPTEIKKYTVNRASFIYKNTREQFEIRVHKRLIDIINPSAKTIESLTNLSLPSGVDIDVKML